MILNVMIMERGKTSALCNYLKNMGPLAYTIVLGEGSASDQLLRTLGLDEIKKEILYVVATKDQSKRIAEEVAKRKAFEEHGGAVYYSCPMEGEEEKMKAVAIHVIVNRGKADKYIELAHEAGSTGATVIHGRGSGMAKKLGFFEMIIEPEKDVVLFVADQQQKEKILPVLQEELEKEGEQGGFLFVLPVLETVGLRFSSK